MKNKEPLKTGSHFREHSYNTCESAAWEKRSLQLWVKPASSLQWKIKICSSKSIICPEHTLCTWTQQSGEGFASWYTLSDNTHFPSSKLYFSLIAKTFSWLYSYPRLLPLQQLQKSYTWTIYLWTKVTDAHTELLFSMQGNLDLKWINSHNSIQWKCALLDYSDFAN